MKMPPAPTQMDLICVLVRPAIQAQEQTALVSTVFSCVDDVLSIN